MTALLRRLIGDFGERFRCAFSLTGTLIEQLAEDAPDVLELFRELSNTGCVEFLAETYFHSLSAVFDRDEFERQLPGAVDNRPFTIVGDLVTVPEGHGQVRIRLADLGIKQLGQLDLPMMRLDFSFHELTDNEIDSFMDGYDRRTLRGGGGM